jgi:hypothetical protein
MTKTTANDLMIAGAAAEGHGALTGWDGAGPLRRDTILEKLPKSFGFKPPTKKSDVGYAGNAIQSLRSLGFVTRRDRSASWYKPNSWTKKTREYRARWIVFKANTTGNVGDKAGAIFLTAELHDGSDVLHIDGDATLADRVQNEYRTGLDNMAYDAGEVTTWLKRELYRVGAAKFSVGTYIPTAGREAAEALIAAIASTGWGANWASPMLPTATGPELIAGLINGFVSDIRAVASALAKAKAEGPVDAAAAVQFLKKLQKVDARADGYRTLCGDDAMRAPAQELAALHTELAPLANDTSLRFALLDLDGGPTSPVVPVVSEATAVAAKRVDKVRTVEDYRRAYSKALKESGTNAKAFKAAVQGVLARHKITAPTPADWARAACRLVKVPAAPATPADDDSSQRFALLEMD